MLKNENIKRYILLPHNLFLCLGLFIGSLHLYFVPPLQAPDEFAHFYRALSISEGNFLPIKENNRLGSQLPGNLKTILFDHYAASVNEKYKLNEENTAIFFNTCLNDSTTEFIDFPNTSYYSPVSYLPHSIFLFLLKPLNLKFGTLFFTTKALVYLVWLFCLFYFIKTIPLNKYLFVLLCLLPMHIYLANSFSADTVTIITSFLLVGKILEYSLRKIRINGKQFSLLIILGVMLALAKIVYSGLILTVLMLPVVCFNSKAQAAFFKFLIISVCLFSAYCWSNVVMQFYTPFAGYNPKYVYNACVSPCANYDGQKMFIMSHPSYFPWVISRSLFDHPYTYLHGYIGNLGNSDIPLPKYLIVAAYLLIFFTTFFEKNNFRLTLIQKLILVASTFSSFILLLLSQHLTWDCIGEGIVDLVQGRYLIPLLPWVLLFFSGFIKKKNYTPVFLIVVFLLFANAVAINLVNDRFYKKEFCEEINLQCDAERKTSTGELMGSDTTILLRSNGCTTTKVSHSDSISLKLSVFCPYGFTTNFKGVERGDLVEISAWQKGNSCQYSFVVSGPDCEDFYYMGTLLSKKDTSLWRQHKFVFTVAKSCNRSKVTFYFWNTDTACAFIDDIQLSIKKFEKNYLDKKRLSLFPLIE